MGVDRNEITKRNNILFMPSIKNTKAFSSLRWIWRNCADLTISWNKKSHVKYMPDDVIINIFSRLPVECVVRCKVVCKRWFLLFSSPHFARMHLRRDVPVLLLQNTTLLAPFHQSSLVTFNGGNMKKHKTGSSTSLMKMIGTEAATLYGSCNGLLVFRRGLMDHLVCNPITREQFTIKQPPTSLTRLCCGILFQPRLQEHVLVFSEEIDSHILYEYSVYTVSSKSWKRASTFQYKPVDGANAIVFNKRLHWMAAMTYHDDCSIITIPPCMNSIISCDMEVEDFHSMPHPGKECQTFTGRCYTNHLSMRLLEMKGGVLCYGDYDHTNFIIRLWMLEDYETWSWVLNYNIDISSSVRKERRYNCHKVKIMKVEGDELMFTWNGEELFSHHLVDYTMRRVLHLPKIAKEKVRKQQYGHIEHACKEQQMHHWTIVSYTKSFLSLSS